MAKTRKTPPTAETFVQQPKVSLLLKALRSRRGATIAELAGDRELHTIRAILSRLRTVAGFNVTYADGKRGQVYRASSPKKRGGAK